MRAKVAELKSLPCHSLYDVENESSSAGDLCGEVEFDLYARHMRNRKPPTLLSIHAVSDLSAAGADLSRSAMFVGGLHQVIEPGPVGRIIMSRHQKLRGMLDRFQVRSEIGIFGVAA